MFLFDVGSGAVDGGDVGGGRGGGGAVDGGVGGGSGGGGAVEGGVDGDRRSVEMAQRVEARCNQSNR